jgi:hypothetical protein
VQRRRKPKSEPRNIFDKTAGGKSTNAPPKSRRGNPSEPPRSVKPSLPPSKPAPVQPKPVKTQKPATPEEPDVKDPEEDNTILEEQLLGVTKRPTRGLTQSKEPAVEEIVINPTSTKAQEIIEASKARANAMAPVSKPKPQKSVPAKSRRPPRSTPKFQPATREKRLDRSRHMEYKYEMRGLLKELDVAEEHRSALLGSIWAKGERQTSDEARQYIWDKQSEGILDEEQVTKLLAIVDDYTIRR